MKSYTRILFAVMLCFFIYQNNAQGQALKKAMSKVKGAVSDVKGTVNNTTNVNDQAVSNA